jgi:hypothetical protein
VSLLDKRFAPLDDRGSALGASALKQGIEQLVNDVEVQEQVARALVSMGFELIRSCPEYLGTRADGQHRLFAGLGAEKLTLPGIPGPNFSALCNAPRCRGSRYRVSAGLMHRCRTSSSISSMT